MPEIDIHGVSVYFLVGSAGWDAHRLLVPDFSYKWDAGVRGRGSFGLRVLV
jgi:hypothetical protein